MKFDQYFSQAFQEAKRTNYEKYFANNVLAAVHMIESYEVVSTTFIRSQEEHPFVNRTPSEVDAAVAQLQAIAGILRYKQELAALPVELASFRAVIDRYRSVRLEWNTVSEPHNASFEVQYRAPNAAEFATVNFIEGNGTTSQPQSYAARLSVHRFGTHEFRLKQVDEDGTSHLSKTISQVIRPKQDVHFIGPKPVRSGGQVRLFVSRTLEGALSFALYNALGQRVSTFGEKQRREGRISLSLPAVSAGMYFLRVEGEGLTKTYKVPIL
jgi:hypothetical protein